MNTFEIRVQKIGDRWDVIVEYILSDTLLPIRAEGEFCVNLDELRKQETPLKYGTVLGKALFGDTAILLAFKDASGESQRNSESLRILLFIEDKELRTLRWERLCISTDGKWSLNGAWNFLALTQQLPFSLYLPSTIDRRFPPIGKRDLRALVIVASPDNLKSWGLAPFDAAATTSAVKTALGEIPCDVLATVKGAVGAPTLDELSKRLVEKSYTLLHFVCHGQIIKQGELKGETQLYLADASNQVDPVDGSRLLETLGNTHITRLPHFAFLCTCHSADIKAEGEGAFGGLAQRLVRDLGMPAVVAMTKEVSIKTAEALSGKFYQQLREHGYVDSALVEATAGLAGRFDITVPALFSRLGGRPLFSDKLDRSLTDEEIKFGLSRLQDLLVRDERAPVLQEIFETQAANLLQTIGAESDVAKKERKKAMESINQICGEVLDLSFRSVALNEVVPLYDNRCPFRGLYPFHLKDREFFFGREALIEQLQQKLTEHNFLAVLGASGSGKSSVVLAGLIPALQKQEPDLQIAYLTPSSNPLAQLEVSLAKVQGQSFIIVVDQFEELFTLCTNKADRQTFISRLLTLLQNQKIVTTMRADFWGECAPYQELKELMEVRQKLIAPMNTAELRKSMEGQATKVKLRFEAGLSNLVLDEVQDEPGAMPLLQHALLELWNRRHGRWLSRSEYEEIGGVKQAIAKTANDFYIQLQPYEQEQVRNIFVRLTRLDEEVVQGERQRDTRRRVALKDLAPVGTDSTIIKNLVTRLADAGTRLVVTSVNQTSGEEEVEVAHEALIRHWSELGKWLDVDRLNLLLRQRINREAEDWDREKDETRKVDLLLLTGGRLDDTSALADRQGFFNALEQRYVKACLALREKRQQEELERERQISEERRQRLEESEYLRNIALARQLAAQAELIRTDASGSLIQSVLLALESHRRFPTLESDQALSRGLSLLPCPVATMTHEKSGIKAVLSPDGRCLATVGWDRAARVWQVTSGEEIFHVQYDSEVQAIAFSPDGRYLATGSSYGDLSICEANSGYEVMRVKQEKVATGIMKMFGSSTVGCSVDLLAFSPDGQYLATASCQDGLGWVWDVISGQSILNLMHGCWMSGLAFSPSSEYVASADWNGLVQVWTIASCHPIIFIKHEGGVITIAFSPDRQHLATVGWDKTVRVWEVTSGQEIAKMSHDETIEAIAFSSDGKFLATAGRDDKAQVWEATTGKSIACINHRGNVVSVAFSANNRYLATASWDKTACVWDIVNRKEILCLNHPESVLGVIFSQDNHHLVTTSRDNIARIWKVTTGKLITYVNHKGTDPESIEVIAFSADGNYLATAAEETARVWEVSTGQEIIRFIHNRYVKAIAFSPTDSKYLATAGLDGICHIWEALSGKEISQVQSDGSFTDVTFSPDGNYFATASSDNTARIWEVSTGKQIICVSHDSASDDSSGIDSVAFSSNGEYLATGGSDNTARVWQVSSGKELGRLKHQESVKAVAFSPNSQFVATGSYDDTARILEVASGRETALLLHEDSVNAIAFSPDGRFLATACDGTTARVWDVFSGQEVSRTIHAEKGVKEIAFSPDGRYVVSASSDKTARVWQAATGQETLRVTSESSINALAFSSDGRYLATTSWNAAQVWQWKVQGSHEIACLRLADEEDRYQSAAVSSIAFSPDGKSIATGAGDDTVRVWQVPNGEEMWCRRHQDSVQVVAFSRDGEYLASASSDNTAKVWEVKTGKEVTSVQHGDTVNDVTFSPNGEYLATASSDGTAKVGGATSGIEVVRVSHQKAVGSLTFSSDGHYLATAGYDATARVWEIPNGNEVICVRHDHSPWGGDGVHAVAFTPDDKYLVTSSSDCTARVWDVSDGHQIARMTCASYVYNMALSPDGKYLITSEWEPDEGKSRVWETLTGREVAHVRHESYVFAVAFSPDGKYVAASGGDATVAKRDIQIVRVWEAATGRELARMKHRDMIDDVTFSPDGKYLATASKDGTARIWIWRPHDMATEVGQRLPRNLTWEEWRQYLENEPYRKTCPNLPIHGSFIKAIKELVEKNEVEAAIAQLEAALISDANLASDMPSTNSAAEARQIVAQTLLEVGTQLAEKGEVEAATAKFQAALALAPKINFADKSNTT